MKVYCLKSNSLDGLQQVEEPDLRKSHGREVLVRPRASSLNYRDWWRSNGTLASATKPGGIPLCDGAGEVLAVGSGVTQWRPGDRVAATYHADWIAGSFLEGPSIFGRNVATDDGMLVQMRLLDERELVRLPDHLSFEVGATLLCSGVTALSALYGSQPLLPGQNVLVQGTGGMSIFALQLAKLSGARVIAITTSLAKINVLKKLGADVVIDASRDAGWHRGVLEATGGQGVDLAIDVIGSRTWEDTAVAIREIGQVSLVGAFGGLGGTLSDTFMLRGLQLHAIRVGCYLFFERMNRALAFLKVYPVIDRIFEFGDAPAVCEHFQ